MVICLCNLISEDTLKSAIQNGTTTVEGLRQQLGIGMNCGCCTATAKKYIIEHHQCMNNCKSCPKQALQKEC